MSQHVYAAAGVTLVEQAGKRVYSAGSGDGRLDILETEFCCLQGTFTGGKFPNIDDYIKNVFTPYSKHPSLNGYFLLPGRASAAAGWPGIARIQAVYIGCNDFPNLPDAYIEAQDAEALGITQVNQVNLTLNYDVFYIMHVHYGEQPHPSLLVNNIYSISEVSTARTSTSSGGGGAIGSFNAGGTSSGTSTVQALSPSSAVALFRTETLVRHGSFSILRSKFIPINIAAVNLQLVISNSQIYLKRINDPTISILQGAIPADATPGQKLVTSVSMGRCTINDTFFKRLAASKNNGSLVTSVIS